MSHGPLICELVKVSTTLPMLSSTIRHPALAVAEVPSEVGRLPTTTKLFCTIASAVVRPTPPVHAASPEICANKVFVPPGEIWTMVVPVPCLLELALKLLTKMSPTTNLPTHALFNMLR